MVLFNCFQCCLYIIWRDCMGEGMAKMKYKNGYLDSLWSKAVKANWNNCCALCFKPDGLDAHHVIPRRASWALRWDIKNGVALCRECHSMAHLINIRDKIERLTDKYYLEDMQMIYKVKHEYLWKNKLSEEEFREQKAAELKEIARRI